MRGDLAWRAIGVGLFTLACFLSQAPVPAGSSSAIETGLPLLAFCLAIAGVMLLVSGRRWLNRVGDRRAMPIVRARATRRTARR